MNFRRNNLKPPHATFPHQYHMPKGCEDLARSFYAGLLGLKEFPKPEAIRGRGGVWFEADGLDIHVSVEEFDNLIRKRVVY